MTVRIGASEFDDAGGECQSPPIGHRLTSVDCQIQEHLRDLIAIGSRLRTRAVALD